MIIFWTIRVDVVMVNNGKILSVNESWMNATLFLTFCYGLFSFQTFVIWKLRQPIIFELCRIYLEMFRSICVDLICVKFTQIFIYFCWSWKRRKSFGRKVKKKTSSIYNAMMLTSKWSHKKRKVVFSIFEWNWKKQACTIYIPKKPNLTGKKYLQVRHIFLLLWMFYYFSTAAVSIHCFQL